MMNRPALVCELFSVQILALLPAVALLVLLQGCSSIATDPEASDSVVSQDSGSQWIQFGVLLTVQPVELLSAEGERESGMRMEVVLDDGRSLVVEQSVSQAGALNPGDRVRLLQIGGYSQVTFWPYQKGSLNEPVKVGQ